MIDLGQSKLAIIGVVALIVIGPEKLPKVARVAGSLYGRAQRYLHEVKSEVSREIELDELRNLLTRLQVEELGRQAHLASAAELLAAGGPIGRKLDFLAQELGREANTLCAKANDITLSRIGLDLKAVVEQFREQVQNVE